MQPPKELDATLCDEGRLTPEQKATLEKMAADSGLTLSQVISRAVGLYAYAYSENTKL